MLGFETRNSIEHTSVDILLLIFDDNDNNGLTDEWVEMYGKNPYSADSNQNSLNDSLEIDKYSTNPLDSDLDNDSQLDKQEVWMHNNPFDSHSTSRIRLVFIFSTTIPRIIFLSEMPAFVTTQIKKKNKDTSK